MPSGKTHDLITLIIAVPTLLATYLITKDPNISLITTAATLFGGMMSIEVKGGRDAAMKVAANTKIFIRATSLGGAESLIEHRASIEGPGTTSPQGLLRVSIGLENADDLIEDLDQALG